MLRRTGATLQMDTSRRREGVTLSGAMAPEFGPLPRRWWGRMEAEPVLRPIQEHNAFPVPRYPARLLRRRRMRKQAPSAPAPAFIRSSTEAGLFGRGRNLSRDQHPFQGRLKKLPVARTGDSPRIGRRFQLPLEPGCFGLSHDRG
jgi:hypothetical protein